MEKGMEINGAVSAKQAVAEEKRKISFAEYVYIYLLGGLVGTVYETILNLVKGKGFVFCNGSILTPFNFVYGAGAVFIIMLLHNRKKFYEVYLIGALGGGVAEYTLSFLEEKILGAKSWDYSDLFLNINGRTTIPIMLFWGLLCLAVVYLVYRPLDKAFQKLPRKAISISAIIIFAFLVFDLSLTMLAIFRFVNRSQGLAAMTFLGRIADGIFTDEFMALRFATLKF
ncbi:MAG: putative ABC transporter permease [Candidatus Borkfalkiaceae bacterium]|nr:putative ABC transporter permease [Christensenellaceae bacterium]